MTDLDRQIAEIKGWRELDGIWAEPGVAMGVCQAMATSRIASTRAAIQRVKPPEWSTSDSKALELVDELIQVENNKPKAPHWGAPSLGFSITRERGSGAWCAHLSVSDQNGENTDWHAGAGPTRPEAICRAYIAAMKWLNSRKKEA